MRAREPVITTASTFRPVDDDGDDDDDGDGKLVQPHITATPNIRKSVLSQGACMRGP